MVSAVGMGETLFDVVGGAAGEAAAERVPAPPGVSAAEAEGLVAARVEGHALRPFRDGWLIYYRPSDHVPDEAIGRWCVVELADGRKLVKEVRRGREGLFTLLSIGGGADPLEDQPVISASPIVAFTQP